MTERLPPAEWTRREDIAALIAALGADNTRFVGGAVRDTMLGLAVKDIDVATRLKPAEVIARLDAAQIRNVPTGIDHGTVTAVLPRGPVEITTLRHDVSTDGRRATVAFATDWKEDAARRDFTINALYAHPESGDISDYFGGLADLAARRVRFIGDARQRIAEDHLRILRYFRFQARFSSQPADSEAEQACAEMARTLKGLSRERIGMETMNLLSLPDPSQTAIRMAELGIWSVILPEALPAGVAALVSEESRQGIPADAIRRLAALLPSDAKLAETVASRFRLSGAQKKRLVSAAQHRNDMTDARVLAYRLGMESALDCLLLSGRETAPLKDWQVPVFPLKGGQVVARGIKAGPEVAKTLQAVESRWIAEGFPAADRVMGILDEILPANG